jgi:tRNA(fMet)-specific endonuclease VapC
MKGSGAERIPPRLVLDTSAYSRLRTGHARVLDLVARCDLVQVPVTVLGELEAGFRLGSRYLENRRALEDFLAEPFVAIEPISEEAACEYGRLFAELRRKGTPIPTNDLWIAAATLCARSHLLTFDGDFRTIKGLSLTVLADEPAPG